MSGGFPLGQEICNATSIGANLATSLGTVITAGGSPATKGAYTQLIASTANDTAFISIQITGFGGSSPSGSVDIAIGAAASELIIIDNLILSDLGHSGMANYFFPVSIPAGTRISARCMTFTSGDTMQVSAILFDGAFTQIEGASGVDSIGFTEIGITGTVIDPGATPNTKGSYAQLVASTSKDYLGFTTHIDVGSVSTTAAFPSWLFDVAIGAGGSEKIILPNQAASATGSVGASGSVDGLGGFFPIPIPAGTRIAARSQCNTGTAADRTSAITLYGVYQ